MLTSALDPLSSHYLGHMLLLKEYWEVRRKLRESLCFI